MVSGCRIPSSSYPTVCACTTSGAGEVPGVDQLSLSSRTRELITNEIKVLKTATIFFTKLQQPASASYSMYVYAQFVKDFCRVCKARYSSNCLICLILSMKVIHGHY